MHTLFYMMGRYNTAFIRRHQTATMLMIMITLFSYICHVYLVMVLYIFQKHLVCLCYIIITLNSNIFISLLANSSDIKIVSEWIIIIVRIQQFIFTTATMERNNCSLVFMPNNKLLPVFYVFVLRIHKTVPLNKLNVRLIVTNLKP